MAMVIEKEQPNQLNPLITSLEAHAFNGWVV
jgi:hypothetical protein